jgi:hypothetical protein
VGQRSPHPHGRSVAPHALTLGVVGVKLEVLGTGVKIGNRVSHEFISYE